MKPIKALTDKQIALAFSLLNQIHLATNKNQEIEKKLDILNNLIVQMVQKHDAMAFEIGQLKLDLKNKGTAETAAPKTKRIIDPDALEKAGS